MAEPSSEKTEEPSTRRLEQARRRGQIARSRDLSAALVTLAVFGVLSATGGYWFTAMLTLLADGIETAVHSPELHPVEGLTKSAQTAVAVLALPFAAALIVALVVGGLQTRGLVTVDPIVPKMERLRFQLSRVFSLKSLVELCKGLILVLVMGAVVYAVLRARIPQLVSLTGARSTDVVSVLGAMLKTLGLYAMGVTVFLGAADYLWQRRRLNRELRMSRDEVKREHKDGEGDPHHKAERQRVYHELMQQRALSDVRKADLIIVNPEHIAIAIRYDRRGSGAPVVVASGEDLMAARIRELAREAGVPIFRDVTLARSLREVNEGEEIPSLLFEAVAELLRIVYGLSASSPAPIAGTAEVAPPAPEGWTRA
ncbi:MAG: EscU/YscU/HrcU family type III secretion system export apparatus switch protein [Deltaproteobacteria bacterium]|nr:EscU/YscU/HrcU family type III secretion system export apparatus switch protein [Deltaproteobacteria bacterium]